MSDPEAIFEDGFERAVELGNRLADADPEADLWDVADGVLAGAIQYWLYAHQPCDDPKCEDCAPMNTAYARLAELQKLVRQFAEDSEYYHAPSDTNVGRA
ncbi:MAG TPA: hypothetical protein VFN52_04290 [Acidiferrobacteraceae bacterium]|nr:hypothetical protein [Acidiferrobacteraceae bacterium]